MKSVTMDRDAAVDARANELLNQQMFDIHRRTDRLFAGLMCAQWLACIAAALWISPRTWAGAWSATHIHVWAAFLLGGAITSLPVLLALARPGQALTRHVIAVAQMLTSALLIHLMGGRIETHFHVFGSLALLAAYRDWRVLLTSTAVIAIDHGIRGALWPESVYGVLTAAPWRTLEHAAWVVFENIFLVITIRQSVSEMRNIALQRAMLEATNRLTEEQVQTRTAELRRAEQRLRLIIDSVPNGVVMINEAGMITLVNPKIEEMFGYSRDELLGQEIEILVPNDVKLRHLEHRNSFFKSPEARPIGHGRDLLGMRKDGSEFPVELGLNPLRTDEGVFVLAAVVDITERKTTELTLMAHTTQLEAANHDLIRTKAELEQKNQELDEFTYVASHDLQEPVRKLISFSKLLAEDLGDELNEQAAKDLNFIVDAAHRMRDLVQALLELSRAGRTALKAEPVSLEDCANRAIDCLELRIEETDARLVRDSLPDVIGDPTVLTQLYQNLIGNALKFIDGAQPAIHLTAERDGAQWILGVKDNGIGMKADYFDRIFQPFQRLHGRGEYPGTGIGLSICKKNVERHGGRIWVESAPGAGSHFKFTIQAIPEIETCNSTNDNRTNVLLSC